MIDALKDLGYISCSLRHRLFAIQLAPSSSTSHAVQYNSTIEALSVY